jgi:hypothetical protein
MKDREEILLKLRKLQDELSVLEKKRADELTKPIQSRSWRLFLFLNREYTAYKMAIGEIEWVLEK